LTYGSILRQHSPSNILSFFPGISNKYNPYMTPLKSSASFMKYKLFEFNLYYNFSKFDKLSDASNPFYITLTYKSPDEINN